MASPPPQRGRSRRSKPGATPPPPPPPTTQLVGTNTIQSQQDSNTSGKAEAYQATATASGSVAQITFYLDASSNVAKATLGIYADNGAATHLGALLTQGSAQR